MATRDHHNGKNGHKPARRNEKAEAMRDAVRKAIESLIEKKSPPKRRPFPR